MELSQDAIKKNPVQKRVRVLNLFGQVICPPYHRMVHMQRTSFRVKRFKNSSNLFQNIVTLFVMWLLVWAQTAFELQALCFGINQ